MHCSAVSSPKLNMLWIIFFSVVPRSTVCESRLNTFLNWSRLKVNVFSVTPSGTLLVKFWEVLDNHLTKGPMHLEKRFRG